MSEGDMDELRMVEMLSGQGGDLEPSPEVVERHRNALRGAIRSAGPARAGGGGPADAPDDADRHIPVGNLVERRRRRRFGGGRLGRVAAAAAVVVLTGAVALVGDGGNDADERVAATGPQAGRADPLTCGPDLPVDVVLPDGFHGPVDGPAGDGGSAPERGQYVVHWASGSGAVEMRWPADAERTNAGGLVRDRGKDYAGNMVTATAVSEASPGPGGRMAKEMIAWLGEAPSEGCEAVQVTVSAADRATVEATADHVIGHLFDRYLPPLVIASRPADMAPPVSRCRAPAGMATPPNKGGRVTGFGTYPSPAATLEAFVETQGTPGHPVAQPGLSRRGYQELVLADGPIAFAYEPTDGFFSTVIRVVPNGEGWTVADWEASGC